MSVQFEFFVGEVHVALLDTIQIAHSHMYLDRCGVVEGSQSHDVCKG